MRPIPSRILLSSLLVAGIAVGLLTRQPIFYLLAFGAGVLLVTTLSTSRQPLTRALLRFRGSQVDVRLWGAPPSLPPNTSLVLTSVNALGPGFHLFFRVAGGTSCHLKIAQPCAAQFSPSTVIVGTARYVQWNGKRLPVTPGVPALSVACAEAPVTERPGGVA